MVVYDLDVRVVTANDLALAILHATDEMGMMGYGAARDMALHVLNFFGFEDQIIDNMLEAPDRNLFYLLEDAHILMADREDVTLYTGREWRIHYWVLNKRRIFELATISKPQEEAQLSEEFLIYHEIPPEIWARAGA